MFFLSARAYFPAPFDILEARNEGREPAGLMHEKPMQCVLLASIVLMCHKEVEVALTFFLVSGTPSIE